MNRRFFIKNYMMEGENELSDTFLIGKLNGTPQSPTLKEKYMLSYSENAFIKKSEDFKVILEN